MAKTNPTTLVEQLQQSYGVDTVMMASDMPRRPATTSGTIALDYATGIGGLPPDRLIEISGKEGTGKTTLALLSMANVLDANPTRFAVLLDLEHKLDKDWVTSLVGEERMSRVITFWPDSAEAATNMYRDMVAGSPDHKIAPGQTCFALFDSIGGAPTARRNDDYTVPGFGGNSLAIGEFARLAGLLSHKYICQTIGVNQVRVDMKGFNRLMVPGGSAWLYHVSMRLHLKVGKGKVVEKINGEDLQVGYEIACKVVKNGLAPPYRIASWWFYNVPTEKYGFGVDTMEEIVRLGTLIGIIERRGAWYHHQLLPDVKGERKVLGRDKLVDAIRKDLALQQALRSEVMAALASGEYSSVVAPMADATEAIPDGYSNLVEELAAEKTAFPQ